ncbi:MAG: HAD-IIA family hydrolase [Candidatus Dadabacteria bacterium]|nr:HAD-IIA family hydrolase [Candidatus Dadabacteria bacterium]
MKLAELFDCLLLDLDGVVYIGGNPTPGAGETIKRLRDDGKSVIFITNDPKRTAAGYSEKLRELGVETAPEDVITSGMALAYHIKSAHGDVGGLKAYVVGSESLKEEIGLTGLSVVDGKEAHHADFVIVGGHPDFHYDEMKTATIAVRNGARFFATNRDPFYPSPEGLIPATGAILACIEVASGKTALTVGKPESIMFEVALAEHLHRDKKRLAIIGDRLDTDIAGGKKAGIVTILTLTGSTKREDIAGSEIKPDYVINDLRDLYKDVPGQ